MIFQGYWLRDRRHIWLATGLSLLLHLVLLGALPPTHGRPSQAVPLQVTLRRMGESLVAAVAERHVTDARSPSVSLTAAAPIRLPGSLSAHAGDNKALAATLVDLQPIPADDAVAGTGRAESTANAKMGTAEPAGDGLDADGLRQYRFSLSLTARRYKLFPVHAQQLGWHGTTEVRVAVGSAGMPAEPQLVRSSGFDLLDGAALDMFRRAAPETSVPPSLNGHAFSVVLPVVFEAPRQ